jgi:hypothetical protein
MRDGNDREEMLGLLLAAGAEPNTRNSQGLTYTNPV